MARKRNRFYTDDTAFLPPPDWQKNQMQANTPADNRAYFPAENAGNIPSGEYWGGPEGEELQGRATIPRVPQMCQSIPEEPVFPALP